MVRLNLTLAETMALQLAQSGVPPYETEVIFHPRRRWRFDFAWPALKVALEVEGGIWGRSKQKPCPVCGATEKGAHGRGTGIERDAEKYSEAAILGWCVIRATPKSIPDGRALAMVVRALAAASERSKQ